MIEPDEAGRRRIAAMPRAEREAWFDRMLAASELELGATVTDWASMQGGAKLDDPTEE